MGFSVNEVCQLMGQQLVSHWQAVKRILRYLKGSIDYGLLLQPNSQPATYDLYAYSDADWASDVDDRRSRSVKE
ncbi:putative mitochondrial protein, partial [Mucuna pruriens]